LGFDVVALKVSALDEHLFLVDVETAGIEKFIASYVLVGSKVLIVETGPTSSIPNLVSGLVKLGVKFEDVAFVAVSHIHLDHGGGVGALLKRLPNARVVVHPRGVAHLVNPEKLWDQSRMVLGEEIVDLYGKPEPVSADRIVGAVDRMVLDVGEGVSVRVLETLGHASHHLSFYEFSGGGLFPGDAAGIYLSDKDVVVPTTPSPFRLDMTLNSLDKLIELKPEFLFYSHFGKACDAVERLRAYGEQLWLWAKAAKEGLACGESVDEIRMRIFEADNGVRRVLDYLKLHRVLGGTVLGESVEGVVGFVEKFGVVPK
jgi:glyoxylase-like metal-dependent hydrolase (beta-lactamase superfamily II)